MKDIEGTTGIVFCGIDDTTQRILRQRQMVISSKTKEEEEAAY